MNTIYNDRRIDSMFYDKIAKTIHIKEILCKGQKLKPEKCMRIIHIWYKDFLSFHKLLEETLTLNEEWQTELITKFTVRGGWVIEKEQLITRNMSVFSLGDYARWFWCLPNGGRVLCCLFTQNEIEDDLLMIETHTHFSGICTMNVKLFVQASI